MWSVIRQSVETDLNSVIPGIRHNDISFIINSHTVGSSELPVLGSLAAQELNHIRLLKVFKISRKFIPEHCKSFPWSRAVCDCWSQSRLPDTNMLFTWTRTAFYSTNLIILSEANTPRRVEMFPHLAIKSILCNVIAVGWEELKPVVPGVRDKNLILRVAGHVPRVHELAVAWAFFSEHQQKLT